MAPFKLRASFDLAASGSRPMTSTGKIAKRGLVPYGRQGRE
jgi:hypothetical protein